MKVQDDTCQHGGGWTIQAVAGGSVVAKAGAKVKVGERG